jgi:[ribosomal protein S5]-alanine N-acetyltransferase
VFPRLWRRGFGRAACAALVGHLFESYGVLAVSALVDTRNVASLALLESLGFQRIRTIEAADELKGSVSNEYESRLANVDWRRRRLA